MMSSVVNVIIPTWKRTAKLRACLQSLEDQTIRPELTYITVRPEDTESKSFLDSWKLSTSLPVKIIEVNKPGVINAENSAITEVLGHPNVDVITFMDDDAIAFPDWIAKIKSFFAQYPQAAALGGPDIIYTQPWSYHDVKVKTVGVITPYGKVIGNHHRKSAGLREVDVLKGVNMSVRRDYLQLLNTSLQGEDPAKGNGVFWELDLCLRIKRSGGKIYFDPDLLINHDSNHSHFIQKHVLASTAHNLALVMLSHLPIGKKIIFLIYSLLVGNSHVLGFAKTIVECFRKKSLGPIGDSISSLTGFFSGISDYTRSGAQRG